MATPRRRNWVADFETTTDPDDCRVWGWGLVDVEEMESPEDVEVGTDLPAFVERIAKLSPAIVYFHNLKFDGRFIVDYLFRELDFKHVTYGNMRRGEFKTVISNMGEWYSLTVTWANGRRTEFRDSVKKLPMSVERLAVAFELPVLKGSIDYHSPRPIGHVPTPEEAVYIRHDVFIVAAALKVQLEEGMTKLTVGSDALAEFKRITGSAVFSKMFPILPESMDLEIRQAYRGGFTYADKRFSGEITGGGVVYDVNSLYPAVMYDRVLPYGEPVFFDGLPETTPDFPLFIVSITFTAKLKRNHIPCIQIKGSPRFSAVEYQRDIVEPVTMMLSNVDLDLWMDHYDLDILTYNGGWKFRGVERIFQEYIDKWMEVKKVSEGGKRELAKLFLNSLYGKFATNPDVTGKYPVMENNIVKLKTGDPETRDPIYTAMGVFITAYARDVTIRAAQRHYGIFAYADTDSLHLLTDTEPTETLDIHKNRLGAWKREYWFTAAMYLRAKQYVEHVGPGHCKSKDADHVHTKGCEFEVHIAGLPRKVAGDITLADVVKTTTFDGKLVPRPVPGGIVLEDVGFTLTV